MCGIAGIVGADIGAVPEAVDERMIAAIAYRGRDDAGRWTDGARVRLFHARLTVIDPETGHQPMIDADQRYVVVYNGEIYNFTELRAEYEAAGTHFVTNSDTEVLLAAYRSHGPDMCARLNGMFALAIWDRTERTLFLTRDRLGKKPLYYYASAGVVYFASTLDAFSDCPGWTGQLSQGALRLFTLIGGFPGSATVYRQARALPAASWALLRDGATTIRPTRYWSLSCRPRRRRLADAIDEYEDILTDAVRIRLNSDVPLALSFSGGVDSGTIAAICVRRLGIAPRAYTIDYHSEQDPSPEMSIARAVARDLGLDWHYINFDYHHDLLVELPEAYRLYDQPTHQMPLVYSHRLYQCMKAHATVVLCGGGADELFAGYDGMEKVAANDRRRAFDRWLPARFRHTDATYMRKSVGQAFSDGLREYCVHRAGGSEPEELTWIDELEDLLSASDLDSFLSLHLFTGLHWNNVDGLFRLPDISGLSAQVEVRSPYLDWRMVEFAAGLPGRLAVAGKGDPVGNKLIPKIYYGRYVEHEVAWAPKKGMGFNIRWSDSLVDDPEFRHFIGRSYAVLEDHGVESGTFRQAYDSYVTDRQSGIMHPASSGTMMIGAMIGAWLATKSMPMTAPRVPAAVKDAPGGS